MSKLLQLVVGAQIALVALQCAANPDGPTGLRPGDDVVITPDGRTIVNPPRAPERGGNARTPAPRRNADGSITYPPGARIPFNSGFTQPNPDGSVTVFPRDGGRDNRRGEPAPMPAGDAGRLRPGDDVVVQPGGRTTVNPPLPAERGGPAPEPAPRPNADCSITYPPGARIPFNSGFTRPNPDGSVTVFPRDGGRGSSGQSPRRGQPRLRPGDDAVITPDGRTTVNPSLPPQSSGMPKVAPEPRRTPEPRMDPERRQPVRTGRIEFGSLVTPDGRRFDPRTLDVRRVRLAPQDDR